VRVPFERQVFFCGSGRGNLDGRTRHTCLTDGSRILCLLLIRTAPAPTTLVRACHGRTPYSCAHSCGVRADRCSRGAALFASTYHCTLIH